MNPYSVLGVSESATDEEISSAYKKLAKRYHPDLHPGDAAAAEQMGRVNNAYNDIKKMRAAGQTYSQYSASQARPGGNPYSGAAYHTYTYYNPFTGFTGQQQSGGYRAPRTNPFGMFLVVFVVIMLVRFLISLMFGGFGGSYYVNDSGSGTNYAVPYYGTYQTMPDGSTQVYPGYNYSYGRSD